ncbi:MAG: type III pantothenate kinase [Oscillospiraceae bacterium]|nr:type III pantothenate kinase [Oscillospiraceae bacterium]
MILTVDAGNTNITLAVYEKEELLYSARIYSERRKTDDQYAYEFRQILGEKYGKCEYEGAVISSVVPEITKQLEYASFALTGKKPLVLGVGVKTKLQINGINKGELGADLVAGAVGAKQKYPMPCLIWDLGTCTKISVLNEKGEFMGCTISPGVNMCIKALGSETSQLNAINISEYSKPFGNTTVGSISSGVIVGTAVMLEGLSKRIIDEMGYNNTAIVATGGLSSVILPAVQMNVIHDKNLLSDGLRAIFEYNRGEVIK